MAESQEAQKNLSISLVICTRNRVEDLRDCFDSMIHQTHTIDEIIIVDSSDNNLTKDLVEEFKARIDIPFKYIHTTPSLTKQRNIGIKESKNEIIAFLDDDVVLEKDYFKEIVKCFMMSDDVMGVGGTLTNTALGPLLTQLIRKMFLYTTYDSQKGEMLRSGFAAFPICGNTSHIDDTEILVGCSCCYRKSIFEEYQFDEFFDGYGAMEDVEFSFRVSKNHRLVYTPLAKLIHKRSPVSRQNVLKNQEMLAFNHYYVFQKLVMNKASDWIFFWWSDFGFILYSLMLTLTMRTILPLRGVYAGHVKIFKSIFASR